MLALVLALVRCVLGGGLACVVCRVDVNVDVEGWESTELIVEIVEAVERAGRKWWL